ncbi:Zn-ribbon domain-containing OB-fold protein [Actinomadura sp. 3N508]|uniref:Zn-ribbon domain-containing OB-fold protein n=1 Tax=Actinomadura sp. 3N508 TaxID=3375153 RepID=UPI0037A671EA
MSDDETYGDPLTAPFWDGCRQGELRVQQCAACGAHQFYPRPFCLSCDGSDVRWVATAGTGAVHSLTEVHVRVLEGLDPPYLVAVIELTEGPRLVSNIVGGAAAIGDRVRVAWRDRRDAPPLPVFTTIPKTGERQGP